MSCLKQDLKILQLIESESNKDRNDGKQNLVDISVQLQNGEIVLIEVQANTETDYFQRMLLGTSKIIINYLNNGKPYHEIKKVYSVNILYFDLGHGKDYIYHGTTRFLGLYEQDELDLNEKQRELYKKEFAHQLYPEYYLIKVNQFNDVAKNTLDEWIYFLKNEEIKDSFRAKGILEAKDKLNEIKLSGKERMEYERYLANLHYEASMYHSNYDSGVLDGKKVGIEEGKQIGIKEGEKIGIEKSKIEMAKKMLKSGVAPETIQQIIGIDINKI